MKIVSVFSQGSSRLQKDTSLCTLHSLYLISKLFKTLRMIMDSTDVKGIQKISDLGSLKLEADRPFETLGQIRKPVQ